MYKSINQWSFPSGMSIREMMTMAKAQGFEGFEPALSGEGELSLSSTDAQVREVREQADEVGIRLASLASGLTWGASPTSNDPAVRQVARSHALRQLECAHILGVDAILLVPGTVGVGFWGDSDPVEYDACWDRALENVMALSPIAEALGVTVGVENVWNNFLMSPLEMRAFIDQAASPRVGAYLDVGNIIKFGMPETWVRILGKRIARVHVKDYKRAVGTLDGFVDLLCGDVNYPEVIRQLKAVGYDGPLTAEMNAGYRVFPGDVVYRTARALELILGER
jgi:hexulose-6-phosphate isomerase